MNLLWHRGRWDNDFFCFGVYCLCIIISNYLADSDLVLVLFNFLFTLFIVKVRGQGLAITMDILGQQMLVVIRHAHPIDILEMHLA